MSRYESNGEIARELIDQSNKQVGVPGTGPTQAAALTAAGLFAIAAKR